jgi:hypothetical protein
MKWMTKLMKFAIGSFPFLGGKGQTRSCAVGSYECNE